MKVLTILHSLTIGGIEKTLYSCLPFLKREGMEISVCCFSNEGNLHEQFLDEGVEIFHIKKTGSVVLDAIQLNRILRNNRFDIVHSRLSYTSGGFALACSIKKIPFLLSMHNEFPATMIKLSKYFFLRDLRKLYLKYHKALTNRFSDIVIGHSKANLDANYPQWEADQSRRYRLVYNGVDFNRLASEALSNTDKKDHRFTFCHVGTFKAQKNHLFLIECFRRLNPVKHNYRLILVGDGPLRHEIERAIDLAGISKNVELVGYSTNVGKYLAKADLFVFPSLFEGLANVLMEAQYLRVPVCASKIKPHYESVHKVYHKYFFDPKNESECVEKLLEIMGDIKGDIIKEELEEIKGSMEEHFSIEQMATNLASIYKTTTKIR